MSIDDVKYGHTAYDDAFRTIEQECDDALIGFVNHMFHQDYDIHDEVLHLRNEHFIERKGQKDDKIISDSYFVIKDDTVSRQYHIECESSGYSGDILVRMFQYDVQAAIDENIHTQNEIKLSIPYTGLLVLRDKGNPPDNVIFRISTPGGEICYKAPVVCMKDYSLERLFREKLYFLLPFYIFNLEGRLSGYNTGEYDIQEFANVLVSIIEHLKNLDENELSFRTKGVIIKQMECVAYRISVNEPIVQEKVGDIMGGEVVKMEWLERYDAAVAEGEAKGEAKGEAERKRMAAEIERLNAEIEKLKAAVNS